MALWGVGIMIGPILGPTLGGYLTEFADWRWVFFINLPVGLLAATLILGFVPETKRRGDVPFDFLGFFLLSLAISALQLVLDRGERLDWFSSNEILIEAVLAAYGLYAFLVHAATTIDASAAASDRVGARISDLGWFVVFRAGSPLAELRPANGSTCGPERESVVVCSQSRSTTAACATHRRS